MTYQRFIALGDSFTEGLNDTVGPSGQHRGWADRVAQQLAIADPEFRYANLAVRGRLVGQVLHEQVPQALRLQRQTARTPASAHSQARWHVGAAADGRRRNGMPQRRRRTVAATHCPWASCKLATHCPGVAPSVTSVL